MHARGRRNIPYPSRYVLHHASTFLFLIFRLLLICLSAFQVALVVLFLCCSENKMCVFRTVATNQCLLIKATGTVLRTRVFISLFVLFSLARDTVLKDEDTSHDKNYPTRKSPVVAFFSDVCRFKEPVLNFSLGSVFCDSTTRLHKIDGPPGLYYLKHYSRVSYQVVISLQEKIKITEQTRRHPFTYYSIRK